MLWAFGNAAFFSLTIDSFVWSSFAVAILLSLAVLIFFEFTKDNKLETTSSVGNKKRAALKRPPAKKLLKRDD